MSDDKPPQCAATTYDRLARSDTRCAETSGHGGRHSDGCLSWEDAQPAKETPPDTTVIRAFAESLRVSSAPTSRQYLLALCDALDAERAANAEMRRALEAARAKAEVFDAINTCVACECLMEEIPEEPPHCLDCGPSEEQQIDWEERASKLHTALRAAEKATEARCGAEYGNACEGHGCPVHAGGEPATPEPATWESKTGPLEAALAQARAEVDRQARLIEFGKSTLGLTLLDPQTLRMEWAKALGDEQRFKLFSEACRTSSKLHDALHDAATELANIRDERDKARVEVEEQRRCRLTNEAELIRADGIIGELRTEMTRLKVKQREAVVEWFDKNKDQAVKRIGDLNGELEADNDKLRAEVERLTRERDEARARADAAEEKTKTLECDLHVAITREQESASRARAADVIVLPVPDGRPGEVDIITDGHSHHYVPSSALEASEAETIGKETKT